jgi:hypothetical protein
MHQQLGHLLAANLGQLGQFVFVDWKSLLLMVLASLGLGRTGAGRRQPLTSRLLSLPNPRLRDLLEPYDPSVLLGLSQPSSHSCPTNEQLGLL